MASRSKDSITNNNKDKNLEPIEEQSSFMNNNSDENKNRNKIFNFKYLKYLIKSLRFVLFYYIDIVKDIYLIFILYQKNEIKSAIATGIIILMPSLFMIVFFIWKEINTTHSLCKKLAYSVYYILIFLTRFHIIIL